MCIFIYVLHSYKLEFWLNSRDTLNVLNAFALCTFLILCVLLSFDTNMAYQAVYKNTHLENPKLENVIIIVSRLEYSWITRLKTVFCCHDSLRRQVISKCTIDYVYQRDTVFYEENFKLHAPFQCWQMIENVNKLLCFLE